MVFTEEDSKFVVSFVINFVIALLFLSLFLFFRKRVPVVYEPRCDGTPNAPPSPPPGIFAWVMPTLRIPTESLYLSHGMDVYMFIRFLECLLFIILVEFMYGVIVLFPVYATGENTRNGTPSDVFVQGLPRLSMASVVQGSNRLVASLFSVIVSTVAVLWFSYKTYNHYARHRRDFKVASRSENYTALVREVPLVVDNEEKLQAQFDRLLPGTTNGVNLARKTPELTKQFAEREKAIRKLEHANAVFEQKGVRPQNKTKFIGGQKVDSIEWWTTKMNEADTQIATLQATSQPPTGVSFITFTTIQSAMQCAQVVLGKTNTWLSSEIVDPRSIIWKNLSINHVSRVIRSWIVNIFIFFLIFFWMIPVTFVSGLSNLTDLAMVPGFGFLISIVNLSPVISGFIQGFLPQLALIIFFALLVTIIRAAANAQGLYTTIALDRSVMSKYFLFEVFNIFLGVTIGGLIFKKLNYILHVNFSDIIALLANALPYQGNFFTNYVMLLSMGKATMSLWRPGPLIVRWIFHKYLSKSPREFREKDMPGPYLYGVPAAFHLLIFLIVSFYSTLYPFILPWGLLYFGMHLLAARYNLIYVYIPQWEGGGYFWPSAFNRICAAALIYQVVMIIAFGIYKFIAGAIISALCAVATIAYWWYTNRRFARECVHGAIGEVLLAEESVPSNQVIGGRTYSPIVGRADDEKGFRHSHYSNEFIQPTMTTPTFQLESKAL